MRKGVLVGAIIGFLAGLLLQSRGSFTTGVAAHTLSPEGFHLIAASFAITLFVAALCGIIGAFLGALLEEVLENNRMRR